MENACTKIQMCYLGLNMSTIVHQRNIMVGFNHPPSIDLAEFKNDSTLYQPGRRMQQSYLADITFMEENHLAFSQLNKVQYMIPIIVINVAWHNEQNCR